MQKDIFELDNIIREVRSYHSPRNDIASGFPDDMSNIVNYIFVFADHDSPEWFS